MTEHISLVGQWPCSCNCKDSCANLSFVTMEKAPACRQLNMSLQFSLFALPPPHVFLFFPAGYHHTLSFTATPLETVAKSDQYVLFPECRCSAAGWKSGCVACFRSHDPRFADWSDAPAVMTPCSFLPLCGSCAFMGAVVQRDRRDCDELTVLA